MKKIIIIALSLVAVLGIALGVVYVIDMNRMKNNIEEIIFLYNKESEAEYKNGLQLSARRLTFEEILNNRKKAIKTLMKMSKSELVNYILGINNKKFLEIKTTK